MKAIWCVGPLLVLTGTTFNSMIATVPQVTSENQPVFVPINSLLSGIARHDAAAIEESGAPGGLVVYIQDSKPSLMTFGAYASWLAQPRKVKLEERIHNPVVRVDNNIASVWSQFEFLADGKVTRCGTRFV